MSILSRVTIHAIRLYIQRRRLAEVDALKQRSAAACTEFAAQCHLPRSIDVTHWKPPLLSVS